MNEKEEFLNLLIKIINVNEYNKKELEDLANLKLKIINDKIELYENEKIILSDLINKFLK